MGGCIGINRNSDNDVDSSSINVSRQTTGGYNIYYNNKKYIQHHHQFFFFFIVFTLHISIRSSLIHILFQSIFDKLRINTHKNILILYIVEEYRKRTVSNFKSPFFNCYTASRFLWLSLKVCGRTFFIEQWIFYDGFVWMNLIE